MRQSTDDSKLTKIAVIALTAVLVLVPFQGLITAWAGSNFGHIDWVRIWKELLLVPISFYALYLVYRNKTIAQALVKNKIFWLILLYIFLHLSLGISAYLQDKVTAKAVTYSWIVNLRFLVIFADCLIITYKNDFIRRKWQKILLYPAAVVVTIGLLLQFVLPHNFLGHFGYGAKTIPAYQTIDQKPDYIRLQSTLRGPNPLGAYLLLIISAAAVLATKKAKDKQFILIFSGGAALALFFTYSRSAWLGLIIALAGLLFWVINKKAWRKYIALVLAGVLVVFAGLAIGLRNNDTVQNTLFHTDEHSQSLESTNTVRTQAISDGVESVIDEPFGRGPGTAGPASFRNDTPRIAENYYIQIGQEVGLIGLALFVSINIYVGTYLWRNRKDSLSLVLLISLIGLAVVNLVSHAWADDTISLIWWGLAGTAIGAHWSAQQRSR